ncbi:winged helix-turn-helix domain-containing protein [Streptomyces sp. BF23-18]|uniref:winged helix-turn-helix domain-containing protein n=1 Tax=Streptomyces sp. BF23-18 TaxID=3240282 RepID=UPI0034E49A05
MLEQELAKGPVAHGWPDQTWTLSRIKTLIGRRFHKGMKLSAIAQMLHRHGLGHTAECGSSSTPTAGTAATSCRPTHPPRPRRGHLVTSATQQPGQHRLHRPRQLMRTLRHGLRQIQYRRNLIDGGLAETGLTLTTPRPQPQ